MTNSRGSVLRNVVVSSTVMEMVKHSYSLVQFSHLAPSILLCSLFQEGKQPTVLLARTHVLAGCLAEDHTIRLEPEAITGLLCDTARSRTKAVETHGRVTLVCAHYDPSIQVLTATSIRRS